MFLSPASGERLGEGAATARACDLCGLRFPLTRPLPRSGGEENDSEV